ncbi:DUF2690 domain-containing protein [Micromonospora sp. NPDC003816]|uniref:DUF2690 domain-containing protein n=1 Tax=Micromonospora sp. NPDC003816 TaxID=3364224 RepID=UPI0036CF06EA
MNIHTITAPPPPPDGTRARAARRTVLAALAALMAIVTAVVAAPTSAQAVSVWSGRNPYASYSGTVCSSSGWQWKSGETTVYDGARVVGFGYLRYSGGCVANWSEFRYADAAAYNDYSVQPSAWEDGKSGTDQVSPDLWQNPVYSRMVDGSGPACGGAQAYRYPSMQWISWNFFTCA